MLLLIFQVMSQTSKRSAKAPKHLADYELAKKKKRLIHEDVEIVDETIDGDKVYNLKVHLPSKAVPAGSCLKVQNVSIPHHSD